MEGSPRGRAGAWKFQFSRRHPRDHFPLARVCAYVRANRVAKLITPRVRAHSTNQFLRSRSRLAKFNLFVRHSNGRTSISLRRMNRVKYARDQSS